MSWEIKGSCSEAIGVYRFPYWAARKDQENQSYREDKRHKMHTTKIKYTHTDKTPVTLTAVMSQCFFTLPSAHYETRPQWELSARVVEWGGATVTWLEHYREQTSSYLQIQCQAFPVTLCLTQSHSNMLSLVTVAWQQPLFLTHIWSMCHGQRWAVTRNALL